MGYNPIPCSDERFAYIPDLKTRSKLPVQVNQLEWWSSNNKRKTLFCWKIIRATNQHDLHKLFELNEQDFLSERNESTGKSQKLVYSIVFYPTPSTSYSTLYKTNNKRSAQSLVFRNEWTSVVSVRKLKKFREKFFKMNFFVSINTIDTITTLFIVLIWFVNLISKTSCFLDCFCLPQWQHLFSTLIWPWIPFGNICLMT